MYIICCYLVKYTCIKKGIGVKFLDHLAVLESRSANATTPTQKVGQLPYEKVWMLVISLHCKSRILVSLKSKCTELSRIAWPWSKFNFPFFRVHSEVFITFQRFWDLFFKYGLVSGIFEKMDFVLSLAKNWPKKLVKNIIAKTSWRQ